MKPHRSGWIIWPPVIIVRYWIVQGALFMNWVERLHRWLLEGILFLSIYSVFLPVSSLESAMIAFFVTHTASAVMNGHLFAMLTHDLFWLSLYKDKMKFTYYIDEMHARILRKNPDYVAGVVFFGSLARGVFRDTSDLDIRFIAKDGFWNAFRTANMVFIERFHALFAGYPIDTYMFITEAEIRKKMDVLNEHPVSIFDGDKKLKMILPETRSYCEFRRDFIGEHSG